MTARRRAPTGRALGRTRSLQVRARAQSTGRAVGNLLICALLTSMLAGIPAARAKTPETSRTPRASGAPTFTPVAGRGVAGPASLAELERRADRDGPVRVIVGLDTDFRPEGRLGGAEVQSQRTGIDEIRGRLLDDLAGTGYEKVRVFQTIPYLALEVSRDALAVLEESPNATTITEDVLLTRELSDSRSMVEAPQMANIGYTGDGQVVAVIDDGIESGHSFLSGKVVEEACYSITSSCPNGSTSQTGPGSGAPCTWELCTHGTHVAGIAAGAGPNFSGVAKDADLMSIQVFSKVDDPNLCATPPPCGRVAASDLLKGLERVYVLASQDAHTFSSVNISLGLGGKQSSTCDGLIPAHKAAIDNLRLEGIATVVAAGNQEFRDGTRFPGCISSAVTVGSTDKTDSLSPFSNMAPWVDLLAPGSSIKSSVINNGFAVFNGTSMATPHVAGAWAVLREQNPTASVADVLNALETTGVPVSDLRTRPAGTITKRRIRIAGAAGVLSPVPNDHFSNSIGLVGESDQHSGHNVGATKPFGEPNHGSPSNPGGSSIWYRWVAPSTGPVTIHTHGSNFDTLLSVYTGESFSSLTEVARNDDVSGSVLTSSVTFRASQNTRYQIALDGYKSGFDGPGAGATSVDVTLSEGEPPTNPTLTSPSHDERTWSGDSTIDVTWSGASDAGSGVDGYSFLWSTNPSASPDTTKDAEETVGSQVSPSLPSGSSHYFHLRVKDNAGNWSQPVHLGPFYIDTSPPPPAPMSAPAKKFQKGTSFNLAWGVSNDPHSGRDGYSVRYQEASFDSPAFGGFIEAARLETATSYLFSGVPGKSYCFDVVPYDNLGNSAAPAPDKCTSVPLDDRALTRSGGWTEKQQTGHFLDTYLVSKKKGSRLTLSGVRARQLALLVTKCPKCGSLQLQWNNRALAKANTSTTTISLFSFKTKKRQLITFRAFPALRTGTVTVKATSPGRRPVMIDGLGVSKT